MKRLVMCRLVFAKNDDVFTNITSTFDATKNLFYDATKNSISFFKACTAPIRFTIDVICRDNISVLVESGSSPDFLIAKFNALVFPVNSSSFCSTVFDIFDIMFYFMHITVHKKISF